MTLRKMVEVFPDSTQPRTAFKQDELQALAHNIELHGQLQPITCYERDGQLILLDGERRYRAMNLLGITEIDVRIVPEPPSKKLSLLQASIDLHRENLNSIERAKLFGRIAKENAWSANETAKQLNISQSTVSEHLQLLRLAPEIQTAVANGVLAVSKAVVVSREPNFASQLELAKTYATLSREQIKLRGTQTPDDKPKVKRASFVMPTGTVIVQGVALALENSIELLQATVKQLKRCLNDALDITAAETVLKHKATQAT